MNTPVPVYIEHADLGNTKGMNTQLDLCTICERHVPGQVLAAQRTNGIWSIWLKNDKARSFSINTTNTLNIYTHIKSRYIGTTQPQNHHQMKNFLQGYPN